MSSTTFRNMSLTLKYPENDFFPQNIWISFPKSTKCRITSRRFRNSSAGFVCRRSERTARLLFWPWHDALCMRVATIEQRRLGLINSANFVTSQMSFYRSAGIDKWWVLNPPAKFLTPDKPLQVYKKGTVITAESVNRVVNLACFWTN